MTQNGFVPGIVHLVDMEGDLRVKYVSRGQSDIVLIPAPSNDLDELLNWSSKRKWLSTASLSICVYHLRLSISVFNALD